MVRDLPIFLERAAQSFLASIFRPSTKSLLAAIWDVVGSPKSSCSVLAGRTLPTRASATTGSTGARGCAGSSPCRRRGSCPPRRGRCSSPAASAGWRVFRQDSSDLASLTSYSRPGICLPRSGSGSCPRSGGCSTRRCRRPASATAWRLRTASSQSSR